MAKPSTKKSLLAIRDLNTIRAFVMVARSGTLNGAAAAQGVQPSLLSRHIRSLETQLGARLLERSPRGMQLTVLGEEFLESCTTALQALVEGESRLAQRQVKPGGLLNVAMSLAWPFASLAGFVSRYCAANPDVRLSLRDLAEPSLDGPRPDLVVGHLRPFLASSYVKRLVSSGTGLYASPELLVRLGTPQNLDDLRHFPLAVTSADHPTLLGWAAASSTATFLPTLSVAQACTLLPIALSGQVIAKLPTVCAWPSVEAGHLKPVLYSETHQRLNVYASWQGSLELNLNANYWLKDLETVLSQDLERQHPPLGHRLHPMQLPDRD